MAQRYLKHTDGTVYAWSDALAGMSEMTECSAASVQSAGNPAPEPAASASDTNDLYNLIRLTETKAELRKIAADHGVTAREGKERSVVAMRKLLVKQLKAEPSE